MDGLERDLCKIKMVEWSWSEIVMFFGWCCVVAGLV